MSNTAYYKSIADRLAGELSRARSRYQAAIREYEASSGDGVERARRKLLDAEKQVNRLSAEWETAEDKRRAAHWADLRRR